MPFRIHAIDPAPFAPLFALSTAELDERLCRRVPATRRPGFPCRVSLEDAAVGEELLLTHFEHQPAATPFRAGHAIYIRRNAVQAAPEPDTIPALFRTRTLSLRAFNTEAMLIAAEVLPGTSLEEGITRMLGNESISSVHIHNAAMGCYLARAERA